MKTFIAFCAVMLVSVLSGQPKNPVTWQAQYQTVSASEGEIIITATIEKGWHTYSQRPTEAGPIPTSFTFAPSAGYQLVGKTTETDAHEEFVKAFDANIFVFTNKAEFRQKIKLSAKSPVPVNIKVEFMSCNDMMCLPPKIIELTVKTH